MRFSWTVISGNSRRPSGQMATPAPTMPGGDMRSRRRSPKRISPEATGTRPMMALSTVLFPAPLAPTIETICRSSTVSVTPWSARTLPYQTWRSRTSRLGILVPPQVGRHHGRVVADALGLALGDLLAVVHHDDLPAELHDEAHVVLDHHDGGAPRVDPT